MKNSTKKETYFESLKHAESNMMTVLEGLLKTIFSNVSRQSRNIEICVHNVRR
jgi:hypothetical protein